MVQLLLIDRHFQQRTHVRANRAKLGVVGGMYRRNILSDTYRDPGV